MLARHFGTMTVGPHKRALHAEATSPGPDGVVASKALHNECCFLACDGRLSGFVQSLSQMKEIES